jgi:hypothetical protein
MTPSDGKTTSAVAPKEYKHWPWCNGDRRVPAGESGHSCCCFNHKAMELFTTAPASQAPVAPERNPAGYAWDPRGHAAPVAAKDEGESALPDDLVTWLDDNLANEEGAPFERRSELMQKALTAAADRARRDEAKWWHMQRGHHGKNWCCERIAELERALAECAGKGTSETRSK